MIPLDRDEIHIISRNSNWSAQRIDTLLKENVYNGSEAWKKFLKTLFISLGVCFTTSGVIFFFAYNWDDLSSFTKIGLIEGLIVIATSATLLLRINLVFRNIILTGAAMLVGVLFAVFGQIYQTGANAYDFFLAWTACITLWVAVSNFPPLWLIFIALVNTTFILYVIQVSTGWSGILIFTLLFAINAVYLSGLLLLSHFIEGVHVPAWFRNTIGIVTTFYATVAVCIGINESLHPYFEQRRNGGTFAIVSLLAGISYAGAIFYSIRVKSGFFISLVLFSMVIIISALLLNLTDSAGIYLFTSMFVIGGITGVIALLIHLHKKWSHG